uniref:Geraniol 8-hydroxylase n=1 Tax=Vitis vinifera TaxID=29760 RepID=F6H7P6_VITVI
MVASFPQTTKPILQNHVDNFLDHPVPDAIMAMPNLEYTLAWIPGDHVWHNRRRVCASHLFTTQRLDSLQHLRQKKVDQLLQHITKHCVLGTPVYITDLASATILNLMSNTMFSIDLVDLRFESAQEFRELMWRIMEGVGKPNISDYFPIFRSLDLQGVKRGTVPSYKRLHEILDGIIHERMKLKASNSTTSMNDFLDVLLDQCQMDGSDFSSKTIKTLLVELVFGGSDTSSITIEWAMVELLRNPHVMQKVRIELSEIISPTRRIKESDID